MKQLYLAIGFSCLFACGSRESRAPLTTGDEASNSPASTTTLTSAQDDRLAGRERTVRRSLRPVTVMDQGESMQERHITQNVRLLLMGDDGLSFRAKNVRIITVGSRVTLLGEVGSTDERAAVEMYAVRTPGVTTVDDRLLVAK